MKKLSLLIFMLAFLAAFQSNAQQDFRVGNSTTCSYTVDVIISTPGSCGTTTIGTTITIPALFSLGVIWTSPAGSWIVGVEILGPSLMLSEPSNGGNCTSFPSTGTFANSCGKVNAQYNQGAIVSIPSSLLLW